MDALPPSSRRRCVIFALAATICAAVPGLAAASLGHAELKIANGCLRSREVLKLPVGTKLSDLRADGKIALERVTVCVERAPVCAARDAALGSCTAG